MRILIKLYRLLLKILYTIYKRFRRYAEPKREKGQWQMATGYDCENLAIMNALPNITYKQAEDALLRIPVWWLQNPIYGNPWNVKEALDDLGVKYEEITHSEIKTEDAVILLLHDPESPLDHVLHKHWIAKPANSDYWCFADNTEPERLTPEWIKKISDCRLFNCILRVREA